MKEFILNNYLSLRLEDNITNIYVNNLLFQQCKHLLLKVKSGEIADRFLRISSIDEAEVNLDKSLEYSENASEFLIPPATEFWAHCSNLQAWAENGYDTRLLHRNLAFPLLKELSKAGDKLALIRFKEEIARRYKNGNWTVRAFLFDGNYTSYLSIDEIVNGMLIPKDAIFMEKLLETQIDYSLVPCFDLIRDLGREGKLFFSIEKSRIKEIEVIVGNALKFIPKEIENLTQLHTLIITVKGPCENLFEQMQKMELKSITNLKIYCYTPITIPDSLYCFPNLESLIVRGVGCKPQISLEKSFLKTIKLSHLHLEDLIIDFLPYTIENLNKLEYLSLIDLSLKDLPIKTLKKLPIEVLDLNRNLNLNLNDSQIRELKKKIKVNYWQS
jgi:hypothetical protein